MGRGRSRSGHSLAGSVPGPHAAGPVGTGWRNSAICCVEGAGLGTGLAGGPAACPPWPCSHSPGLTVPGPGWEGVPGVPWAWPGLLHPPREALSKDFQWTLHSSATQPGSFSALTPPWLSALGGRGGHCQTCLVPHHYLCGLGQFTYPLGAPDPSGRRG